jgi:hypothetical protein
MNEKHAVLPIGGKTRIATWGEEPEFPGRKTIIRFSSFNDFKQLQNKYSKDTRKQVGGLKLFGVRWPPLAELRAKFEAKFGPQTWLCPEITKWEMACGKLETGEK